MADWPGSALVLNKHQVSVGDPAVSALARALFEANTFFSGTATVWPTANLAILVPIQIHVPVTIRQASALVVTTSGNCDFGIYDEGGSRIVSKGGVATAASAAAQKVDLTASVQGTANPTLSPGTYWWAMSCDNIVAVFRATTIGTVVQNVFGQVRQMASAYPLPATITFAAATNAFVPFFTMNAVTV